MVTFKKQTKTLDMKTQLKNSVVITFLLISGFSLFANNMKSNLIDIAREQRVLSQKIAKSYLLLAYGANFYQIRSEIKTSIILFENNLNVLQTETLNEFSTIANAIVTKQANVWSELKKNVTLTPTTKNLNQVVELSNTLLKKTHLVYSAFRAEANNLSSNTTSAKINDLLEISEKQEVTSERLCLYFVAQKINIIAPTQNPKILGTLRAVMEKLDQQLIVLLKENTNNPLTVRIINDALIAFDDIRTNKTDFLDGKPTMNTIYTTTKKLNKLFRILTSEYQELASI